MGEAQSPGEDMGDGRETPRVSGRFSDNITPAAIAARKVLAVMAQEGLCISYTYASGRYALTKHEFAPRHAADGFDKDALDWLLERGLITDAGEPDDDQECRYFLTAEGRRQGRAL
jgi:hypothetical protein